MDINGPALGPAFFFHFDGLQQGSGDEIRPADFAFSGAGGEQALAVVGADDLRNLALVPADLEPFLAADQLEDTDGGLVVIAAGDDELTAGREREICGRARFDLANLFAAGQ